MTSDLPERLRHAAADFRVSHPFLGDLLDEAARTVAGGRLADDSALRRVRDLCADDTGRLAVGDVLAALDGTGAPDPRLQLPSPLQPHAGPLSDAAFDEFKARWERTFTATKDALPAVGDVERRDTSERCAACGTTAFRFDPPIELNVVDACPAVKSGNWTSAATPTCHEAAGHGGKHVSLIEEVVTW